MTTPTEQQHTEPGRDRDGSESGVGRGHHGVGANVPHLSPADAEWAFKNIACFNCEPEDYARTQRLAHFLRRIADMGRVDVADAGIPHLSERE